MGRIINITFKILCIFILCGISVFESFSQELSERKIFALTPELDTEINGVAIGLMINSIRYNEETPTTIINGLNIELIGVGLFGPLAPTNPLIPPGMKFKEIEPILDSLIAKAKNPKPYKINGLNLSAGGLAGHQISMNGLNISGVSTVTAQFKGVSISTLMNMNVVMHGLSLGVFNHSLEHKGLQLGLFNSSARTKGIQIGLWNRNEKRSLPIVNWNFKNKR